MCRTVAPDESLSHQHDCIESIMVFVYLLCIQLRILNRKDESICIFKMNENTCVGGPWQNTVKTFRSPNIS